MDPKLFDLIKSRAEKNNCALKDEEIQKLGKNIPLEEGKSSREATTEIVDLYLLKHKNSLFPECITVGDRSDEQRFFSKTWRSQRRKSVYAERITPENFKLPYNPKGKEAFGFLESVFMTNEIPLGFLNPDQRTRFINSMWLKCVDANTVFIKEGGYGSQMYIIDQGEFDVIKDGKIINKLKRGNLFGEIALLHNTPRTATVVALCDSRVWVAEQTSFSCIRSKDRKEMVRIVIKSLADNNVFPACDMNELERYVDTLKIAYYYANQSIEIPENEFVVFLTDSTINDGETRAVKASHIQLTNFVTVTALRGVLVAYKFRDLVSRFAK